MSLARIGGGLAAVGRPAPQRRAEPAPAETTDAAAPSRPIAAPRRETFIAAVAALRQPPPMPLPQDESASRVDAAGRMFARDLADLARRQPDEVAADLAELYLHHADTAAADPEIAAAFDTLGELMRGYEHLRLLRPGELG